MSFGTQRELSTHEQQAHPAARNIKRNEATLLIQGIGRKKRLPS
jgi:hypothetical protein